MVENVRKAFGWGKSVVGTFLGKNCAMHAAGLTYFSLLSVVPILCVLLVFAKTLGADHLAKEKLHEQFETYVAEFESAAGLAAEPELAREPAVAEGEEPVVKEAQRKASSRVFVAQARELEQGLLDRIDQFNVGTLGWAGFLMLLWSVVGSIGMVEVSFNEIWDLRKQRALWRRIFLYLFVVTVLPILSALALSVPLLKLAKDVIVATVGSLWLTRWVSDGAIWFLDSWLLRYAITLIFATLAFAFLFKCLPNCRVSFRPALRSGFVTAILFGGWLKICAIAQVGIAKTSALYGSFAFLPIVLAWIYMSWQIVLLGCCMVRASSESATPPQDAGKVT